MREPTPPEKPKSSHTGMAAYSWPIALVLIAVIGAVVAFQVIHLGRETVGVIPGTVNAAAEGVAKIAERFNTRQITRTFTESLPELSSPEGGNLEVVTIRVVEDVTESDSLFGRENSSFFTSTSEIRVPVTYRYHIRLNDEWALETDQQTCIVHAPELRPSLPPAIHTDAMTRKTEQGWLRFNAKKQMTELEEGLTPAFSRLAADPRHLDLVRDRARKVIADFIRNWLLRESQWSEDRFRAVVVLFPGEDVSSERPKPTITIDDTEAQP